MIPSRGLWATLRAYPAVEQALDRLIGSADGDADSGWTAARRYGATAGVLALATGALWPLKEAVGLLNIGLVFLVIVVGAATLGDRRSGLLASVLGFLLFDYFLVPPYLTFAINDLHNILALFVFLGLSVLISSLIARARQETAEAQQRAGDVQRLYALGQAALGATRREAALPALLREVVATFGADAGWVLLPGTAPGASLAVASAAPTGVRPPTAAEITLASQAYAQRDLIGGVPRRAGNAPGRPRVLFAPLRVAGRALGVLGVAVGSRAQPFSGAEQTLLATLADQVALALDRLRLRDEADRAELLEQADELKSALIHAVSHDLRTPLASIKATVTSLLDTSIQWDSATQREFLEGVDEECDRLTRLVSNLLDISRIEGGVLHLERDWYDIEEVINTVRRRLAPRLVDHPLTLDIAPGLPLVPLDFVKIDQVLTNLLENALKYTPVGTPITIRVLAGDRRVVVMVKDGGPGVAAQHLPHLFDKFYRVAAPGQAQGSGLGLAIVQGMVLAHGGAISARSLPGQGLTVTFTLPLQWPESELAGGVAVADALFIGMVAHGR